MAEKIVNIADSVTVGELAETLGLSVTTLIGELFKNGIAATINQRLDFRDCTDY
ncbi:translation initiation factor IF-2 N-terminal domain-containing protein [Candidatus Minimicrobia vallesae]|uniref:Translation initiation factor IF-2 N-terminal domain-containing protein n=1 Tax=Candidatus Minimicrobia vallesae TaxID=2841264 RepID=A0A8F1MAV4_9BACT|nr:translation initiation factor IF-2 N-terminal domain-containing protein [Candidatus Minimicrobia vallesae]QWQ31561.1 translation initiation factor IF-2 N-terminal domain-containing protein [Candidatus Minimicrobia vallesae]